MRNYYKAFDSNQEYVYITLKIYTHKAKVDITTGRNFYICPIRINCIRILFGKIDQ